MEAIEQSQNMEVSQKTPRISSKKSKPSYRSHTDVNSPKLSSVGAIVINGIMRLLRGQQKFAEEFGLAKERVFPYSFSEIQGQELHSLLATWLCSENGEDFLQKIFNDLVEHQLALIASIDGVAIKAIDETTQQIKQKRNFAIDWLRPMVNGKAIQQLAEYKYTQEKRYLKIVAPGFVENYSRFREA